MSTFQIGQNELIRRELTTENILCMNYDDVTCTLPYKATYLRLDLIQQ